MKKDEYSFLELFGNIEEEYVYQALKPFKTQSRKHISYIMMRKVAGVAIIIVLGFSLLFHDQVYAAISKLTTIIAEILQISDDLEDYTDIINTTKSINGIDVTLDEIVWTENGLIAAVHLDTESENKDIGISPGESIKINDKEYVCTSSNVYQKQELADGDKKYVVRWFYDEGLPLDKRSNIEMRVVVHKRMEDIEGESVTFRFSASREELQKNTLSIKLHQKIEIGDHEIVLREFSLNSVMSSLKVESEKEDLQSKQYYFEMTDDHENKFLYSMVQQEGTQYIFQNEYEIPSLENDGLMGQLYVLPYEVQKVGIDSEISDVFEMSIEKMKPIGEKFKIIFEK